jgi:hypothetical protein
MYMYMQGSLSNSTQRTTNYTLAFSTTNVDYVPSNKKGVFLRKVATLTCTTLQHIRNSSLYTFATAARYGRDNRGMNADPGS